MLEAKCSKTLTVTHTKMSTDSKRPYQQQGRQPEETPMNMLIEGYFKLLKVLIALFLAIMVVLVFGNVVLRYGFNSGITVSEEVSRWLFVWLTFLGAIIAMREHGHLGVDMLVRRLPNAGKRACLIVSQLLMLYATWLLLQGSWQ